MMKHAATRGGRAWVLGGLCLGFAGGLSLAEATGQASGLPLEKEAESLTLLKPELSALNQGPQPSLMPSLSNPETPALVERPSSFDPLESKRLKDQVRRENWLLEGVREQAEEAGLGAQDRAQKREAWLKNTLGGEVWLHQGGDLRQMTALEYFSSENSPSRKPEAPDAISNQDPLLPFMANWLSPEDLALYKKSQASSTRDVVGTQVTEVAGKPVAAGFESAKNPYLELLNASEPSRLPPETSSPVIPSTVDSGRQVEPVSGPVSGSGSAVPTEGPDTGLRSTEMEEARKYYPQLKRF